MIDSRTNATSQANTDLGQNLIDRRRAYEKAHPDRYFRPPAVTPSRIWEVMQEAGDDDTPDTLLDQDTRLETLLDRLEAEDARDGDDGDEDVL